MNATVIVLILYGCKTRLASVIGESGLQGFVHYVARVLEQAAPGVPVYLASENDNWTAPFLSVGLEKCISLPFWPGEESMKEWGPFVEGVLQQRESGIPRDANVVLAAPCNGPFTPGRLGQFLDKGAVADGQRPVVSLVNIPDNCNPLWLSEITRKRSGSQRIRISQTKEKFEFTPSFDALETAALVERADIKGSQWLPALFQDDKVLLGVPQRARDHLDLALWQPEPVFYFPKDDASLPFFYRLPLFHSQAKRSGNLSNMKPSQWDVLFTIPRQQ